MKAKAAPAIILHDITLRYFEKNNATLLLESFTATLPGSQFNCLLGPSGIGKSSLLRLIAGLIQSTDQEIMYSGAIYADDGISLENRIVYMAQGDPLLPWLNVLDNILLNKKIANRVTRDDIEIAHQLLQKVGLQNIAYRYPKQLSGGMRQRVSLARTLFQDKPIVLMDEPFSALDAITRLRLQDLTVELLQGRTVIIVTHDPQEALRLGQQIFVMMGKPAHLNIRFELNSPIPRAINNPAILDIEIELITQLTKAQETII